MCGLKKITSTLSYLSLGFSVNIEHFPCLIFSLILLYVMILYYLVLVLLLNCNSQMSQMLSSYYLSQYFVLDIARFSFKLLWVSLNCSLVMWALTAMVLCISYAFLNIVDTLCAPILSLNYVFSNFSHNPIY